MTKRTATNGEVSKKGLARMPIDIGPLVIQIQSFVDAAFAVENAALIAERDALLVAQVAQALYLETLQAQLAGKDVLIAQQIAEITDLNDENDTLQGQIIDLNAQVAALQVQVAALQAQLASAAVFPVITSISDPTINETTSSAVFTITLDRTSTRAVNISYNTVNGTATAGQDYTATSGILVIAPGFLSGTIPVPILNDTAVESNEAFTLVLSNPTLSLAMNDSTGTGTIISEDTTQPPTGGFVWAGVNTVWPTAATTGPRTPITTTRAGGNVSGTHRNTRFTSTVIPANGTQLIDCEILVSGNTFGTDGHGRTYTVDHCLVRCTGSTNRQQGVLGTVQLIASNISGFEDGFRATGGGWLARGNFIHDLSTASGAHNDGIQAFDGPGLIEQNYIAARDTSAVMVQSFSNTSGDAPAGVIVKHNWLGGTTFFNLRIEAECLGKGCQAIENAIQRGGGGTYYDLSGADVKTGNIDAATGAAI